MPQAPALNLAILISLVIGSMVGTGVYVLPASLAKYGSIALLSWVYTGIGAMFLALTFAQLSRQFSRTGGPYVYCKAAFGEHVGFIIAYIYWASNLISVAGLVVSSVSYLAYLCPSLNQHFMYFTLALWLEVALVWLFATINMIGLRIAGDVQFFLTLLKLAPLMIIMFFGLGHIHWKYLAAFNVQHTPLLSTIAEGAVLTFWAFIGLEAATVPAEETKGSADIYKATVFGTLFTTLLYLLSTVVLMGMIPNLALQQSLFPFTDAAMMLFGTTAAWFTTLCIFFSGLGAMNVTMLVQAQIACAAARDRLFPAIFARLSLRRQAPVAGQVIGAALISIYLMLMSNPSLIKQFNDIALLAALLTLMTYFVTTLSALKFFVKGETTFLCRVTQPILWIAALASVYSIWMIASLEKKILLAGLIIIILSLPVYGLLRLKRMVNK